MVTREEPPYVMVKCHNCSGNDRYEGFAIDLLQAISQVTTPPSLLPNFPSNADYSDQSGSS